MKQHRTDGVSLFFGLLFLAIAGWWAAAQVVRIQLPALGWLAAGALILFGVLGLLGAIRSSNRDGRAHRDASEASADPTVTPDPTVAAGPNSLGDPYAGPVVDAPETEPDLPPHEHADIVRELLEDPADRLPAQPGEAPGEHADPTAPGRRPA